MTGLTIYRASAGSGKTFTLARDFIRLVIKVPEKYQHILAVTFTNKATAEMKARILGELYKLARGWDSGIRELLEKESGLPGAALDRRAGEILDAILHNYSRFHIETIDHFFQRAIRVFTKEIGLTGGYQIELDSDRVLSEAVDELMHSLDQRPELLEWIVSYAQERVEEGKHWNLKNDILELAREINRERYQEKSHEFSRILSGKEQLQSYREEMDRIRYGFEGRLSAYAREALEIMERDGIRVEDFKHRDDRNIGRFFHRWAHGDYREPNNLVLNSRGNPEEWVKKGSGDEEKIMNAYRKGLGDCLDKCLEHFENNYRTYRSAREIKKYLHVLGLLNEISEQVHACTREQGIFLLSDASRFLQGIIDGNEAPFVYEKIGNYFQHFMIDEFQDTSAMQWKNLLPLVDNSLAFMRENLVVGDVKQSIYRWRNSDWEILSERIQRQFSGAQMEVRGLDRNWRSQRNIVAFNNEFFTGAVKVYSDHFREMGGVYDEKLRYAYSDLSQKIPDLPGKEGGYAHIALLEVQNREWHEEVHRRLIKDIEMLQDMGIQPSETAVLVRSGKDGKRVSDALLDHKSIHPSSPYSYDVISNDSLFLEHASSIRLILGAMRYLDRPENRLNLAELALEYSRLNPDDSHNRMAKRLAEGAKDSDLLPPEFISVVDRLKYLTLTGLLEKITNIFNLKHNSSEIPYLIAFQDIILEYSKSKPADIHSFLSWWKENGENQALNLSEDQNALRVMTIHKAKGLEFRAVIIPYCNWALDHGGGFTTQILWCSPAEHPFDRFPLVPVRYGSSLKNTIFRKDYEDEYFRVYMDHLNLLYVAMTRARDVLIAYGRKSSRSQLATVSDLMERVMANGTFSSLSGGQKDAKEAEWTFGEKKFAKTALTGRETWQLLIRSINSHAFAGKLKLSYRGTDFFDPASEKRINRGNLMHEIFSLIGSQRDVERVVGRIMREGIIDRREAESITVEIRRILEMEPYRSWFDGSWKVIAERDILNPEGTLKRPDRIMMKTGRMIVVDYKFGYVKSSSHKLQVKQYMEILRKMGYKDIRGFVWYVFMRELVEI